MSRPYKTEGSNRDRATQLAALLNAQEIRRRTRNSDNLFSGTPVHEMSGALQEQRRRARRTSIPLMKTPPPRRSSSPNYIVAIIGAVGLALAIIFMGALIFQDDSEMARGERTSTEGHRFE